MRAFFLDFLADDGGAVTVEWVVLGAGLLAFSTVITGSLSGTAQQTLDAALSEALVDQAVAEDDVLADAAEDLAPSGRGAVAAVAPAEMPSGNPGFAASDQPEAELAHAPSEEPVETWLEPLSLAN